MSRIDHMILAVTCLGAGLNRFHDMGQHVIAGNYWAAGFNAVAVVVAGLYSVKCLNEALG